MKPLTPKQIKIAWIIGGILVFVHFLPNIVNAAHHAFATHASTSLETPPSVHTAEAVRLPSPAISPEVIAAGKYGGVWTGNALMPESEARCEIRLEIRLNADVPQKLKGYESKSCVPLKPLPAAGFLGNVLRATSPVSSVMTGTAQEGGISFSVDQTIGTPADGCAMTAFTITEFGLAQMQAQWKEGSCPGGSMLLTKVRG